MFTVFETESAIITLAVYFSFGSLMISLIAALYRLLAGPTLPDRVVALDLIAYIVIAFIAAYAISSGVADFLDAAIVLALIAFLGTVAFARYVQRSGEKNRDDLI